MQIAFFVFDDFTALDAVGPYEVFRRMPGTECVFVAPEAGPIRDHAETLTVFADAAIDDVPSPDVLVVAGGVGEAQMRTDERVLDWVRAAHASTTWTSSVSTGALILGAAGILEGREATTYWLARELLQKYGATLAEDRVVIDGKVATSAGITAGIDLALELVERIEGDVIAQSIQLALEYDPDPPFDSGSPETAPAVITELVRNQSRFAPRPT
ncbi:MAG: DJ-1/PfpI family protein [Acidimicrobiia bacterium]